MQTKGLKQWGFTAASGQFPSLPPTQHVVVLLLRRNKRGKQQQLPLQCDDSAAPPSMPAVMADARGFVQVAVRLASKSQCLHVQD
jgi:hypothetical protein